jgi:hypothetical protein
MSEDERCRLVVGYNGREFYYDFPNNSHSDVQFSIRLEGATEGLCGIVVKADRHSVHVSCKFDSKNDKLADELRFAQAMESFRNKRHPDLQKLLCENRLVLVPGRRYELPLLPSEDYHPMRGLSFDLQVIANKRKRQTAGQLAGLHPVPQAFQPTVPQLRQGEDFNEDVEPPTKRAQLPPPLSSTPRPLQDTL